MYLLWGQGDGLLRARKRQGRLAGFCWAFLGSVFRQPRFRFAEPVVSDDKRPGKRKQDWEVLYIHLKSCDV